MAKRERKTPTKRLLVKIYSRYNATAVIETIKQWKATQRSSDVVYMVVLDSDDLAAGPLVEALSTGKDYVQTRAPGPQASAYNFGHDRVQDGWDAIVCIHPNTLPRAEGWDLTIQRDLSAHFPENDGVLWYTEAIETDTPSILVLGRAYVEAVGYVYPTEYQFIGSRHQVADPVLKTAEAASRLVFVRERIVTDFDKAAGLGHGSPNPGLAGDIRMLFDPVKEGLALATKLPGREIGPVGVGKNVGPLLSVLVCRVSPKEAALATTVGVVKRELDGIQDGAVELLVDDAEPVVGLADRRQRLLERARGAYVCFVDSGDSLRAGFVQQVCAGLALRPDCVSMAVDVVDGRRSVRTLKYSLQFPRWNAATGCMHPIHLNAIRRTSAVKSGFVASGTDGGDRPYGERLVQYGLLRTQAPVTARYIFDQSARERPSVEKPKASAPAVTAPTKQSDKKPRYALLRYNR